MSVPARSASQQPLSASQLDARRRLSTHSYGQKEGLTRTLSSAGESISESRATKQASSPPLVLPSIRRGGSQATVAGVSSAVYASSQGSLSRPSLPQRRQTPTGHGAPLPPSASAFSSSASSTTPTLFASATSTRSSTGEGRGYESVNISPSLYASLKDELAVGLKGLAKGSSTQQNSCIRFNERESLLASIQQLTAQSAPRATGPNANASSTPPITCPASTSTTSTSTTSSAATSSAASMNTLRRGSGGARRSLPVFAGSIARVNDASLPLPPSTSQQSTPSSTRFPTPPSAPASRSEGTHMPTNPQSFMASRFGTSARDQLLVRMLISALSSWSGRADEAPTTIVSDGAEWSMPLGDDGAAAIAAMLLSHTSPTTTTTTTNSNTTAVTTSTKAVSTAVEQKRRRLQGLALPRHDIGELGAVALLDALATAESTLLSSSSSSSSSPSPPSSSPSEDPTSDNSAAGLQYLDLSGNPLGSAGVSALGRFVRTARALQLVDIEDTRGVSAEAWGEFADAVASSSSLVDIRMHVNVKLASDPHSKAVAKSVTFATSSSSSSSSVSLLPGHLSARAEERIRAALTRNRAQCPSEAASLWMQVALLMRLEAVCRGSLVCKAQLMHREGAGDDLTQRITKVGAKIVFRGGGSGSMHSGNTNALVRVIEAASAYAGVSDTASLQLQLLRSRSAVGQQGVERRKPLLQTTPHDLVFLSLPSSSFISTTLALPSSLSKNSSRLLLPLNKGLRSSSSSSLQRQQADSHEVSNTSATDKQHQQQQQQLKSYRQVLSTQLSQRFLGAGCVLMQPAICHRIFSFLALDVLFSVVPRVCFAWCDAVYSFSVPRAPASVARACLSTAGFRHRLPVREPRLLAMLAARLAKMRPHLRKIEIGPDCRLSDKRWEQRRRLERQEKRMTRMHRSEVEEKMGSEHGDVDEDSDFDEDDDGVDCNDDDDIGSQDHATEGSDERKGARGGLSSGRARERASADDLLPLFLEGPANESKTVGSLGAGRGSGVLHLDLAGLPGVANHSLQYIAKRCPNLRTLNISGCVLVTDQGLAVIAQSCTQLQVLIARRLPSISDKGLSLVAKMCPRLRAVDVAECPRVGDGFIRALVDGQCAASIRALHLPGSAVTGRGLRMLADPSALPLLASVNVKLCGAEPTLGVLAQSKDSGEALRLAQSRMASARDEIPEAQMEWLEAIARFKSQRPRAAVFV